MSQNFYGPCPHASFDDVETFGGDIIGKQCRVCLKLFGPEPIDHGANLGSSCRFCDPAGCSGKCSAQAMKLLGRRDAS